MEREGEQVDQSPVRTDSRRLRKRETYESHLVNTLSDTEYSNTEYSQESTCYFAPLGNQESATDQDS